jgi:hypothetical protein
MSGARVFDRSQRTGAAVVRATQEVCGDEKASLGPRKDLKGRRSMRPIDDESRDAIEERAEEIEDEGSGVSLRALAREFGVSPQTIARVLDGPRARRGAVEDEDSALGGRARTLGLAAGAAAVALILLGVRRKGR